MLVCFLKLLSSNAQRDGKAILENVSVEGAELPGCQGRLQNPGKLNLLTEQTPK